MKPQTEPIIVYGAEWCADCARSKQWFDAHQIPYTYRDIDEEAAAKTAMLELTDQKNVIPTIVFADGSIMQEPTNDQLAEKMDTKVAPAADVPKHDVIMVGAGPAALSAAIYTTREDIETLLFERAVPGGLAAVTDWVDNYPGFPEGVAGLSLATNLQQQAERFGAVVEFGEVLKLHDEGEWKRLETTSGDMRAKVVLIATGSDYKKIGVPGEKEYYGRGVHYCATCDGAFYRDRKLVVVGGGNSAVQEAIFLTRYASHIDLLVRSTIKASDVLQHDLQKHVDEGKITVHLHMTTDEIVGDEDNKVVKVIGTDSEKHEQVTIETDGVFIFVGLDPNSGFVRDQLELDEIGLIKADDNLMTSIPGVFIAGDIRHGATMQIASATGEGATAALKIREYLEDREHAPQN